VLNTGTNALSVIFTPSDTEDYGNATNMVSLIVSPTTLTVTAANTNRTYGQANPVFMGTVTGLTNGDDITASYSCSATTASPVGTYAIAPSLTDLGDRLTNYTVSLINGTLAVAQAVSGISWANPIAIIYGTALASNQLNATANVPGIFTYAPSNGTVPGVGTNTLYVVFTPSDTVDYNNATNTVSLIVSSAPLTIVSGVAANSKVYDGTTAATLSFNDVTLAGILNGDSVSLATNGYSAAFESAGVGHAIAVTVSGLTLTGPAAGNYILTQPVTLAADITLPSLQVAARFPNIVLLWTTNATVFVLNQTRSLIPPVNWSPVTNSITASGTNNTVLVNAVNGVQYFELIAAP